MISAGGIALAIVSILLIFLFLYGTLTAARGVKKVVDWDNKTTVRRRRLEEDGDTQHYE